MVLAFQVERDYGLRMPPSEPLPSDLRARLAFAVATFGGARVAAAIGTSKQTLYRGISGCGIYGGNRALIEARIGEAEALKGCVRAVKDRP